MTEVLKWMGIGAAAWFALSVLVAAGWSLFKRSTGPRPVPGNQHLDNVHHLDCRGGDR